VDGAHVGAGAVGRIQALPLAWPGRGPAHDARVKNRIKVLRAQRDWTQAALAERLGVARQTVHVIETGKFDPSLPLAFKIARVFGCAIEDVFDPDA